MQPLVLTARQTAEALKMRPDQVLKLLESGEIGAYRVGRNWKVPVVMLQEYVLARATCESQKRRKGNDIK